MRIQRTRKIQPTIPMVSMADVAFLLITFFLMVTTFTKDAGLKLKLPGAQTAQPLTAEKEINVKVTRDRKILLDEQPISLRHLPWALREKLRQTGIREVTIRGDRQVAYGVMVAVMDVVNAQGAKINLAAEKVSELDLEQWEGENGAEGTEASAQVGERP